MVLKTNLILDSETEITFHRKLRKTIEAIKTRLSIDIQIMDMIISLSLIGYVLKVNIEPI